MRSSQSRRLSSVWPSFLPPISLQVRVLWFANQRLIKRWIEIRRGLVARYRSRIAILRPVVAKRVIVASLYIESVPLQMKPERGNKSCEIRRLTIRIAGGNGRLHDVQ